MQIVPYRRMGQSTDDGGYAPQFTRPTAVTPTSPAVVFSPTGAPSGTPTAATDTYSTSEVAWVAAGALVLGLVVGWVVKGTL